MDNWFESESVGGGYEREQEADNPKQTNGSRDEQRRYGDDDGGDEENNNGGIIVVGAENNHKSRKRPHPMPCSNRMRSGSSSTRRGESESKLGSSRRRNYRKRSRGSDDFGFEDAERLAEEKLIECVDGDGDLVARKLLALQNKEENFAQPQAAAHVVASAASPPPPPPPLDYFRLDMSASEWFRQLDNCTGIREAEEALKKELFTEPLDISDDSNCRGRHKCFICFCDVCHELRRGFYTYYNSSQRRSPDCDEVFEEKMSRDTWARIVASNPDAARVAALSAAADADERLDAHCLSRPENQGTEEVYFSPATSTFQMVYITLV